MIVFPWSKHGRPSWKLNQTILKDEDHTINSFFNYSMRIKLGSDLVQECPLGLRLFVWVMKFGQILTGWLGNWRLIRRKCHCVHVYLGIGRWMMEWSTFNQSTKCQSSYWSLFPNVYEIFALVEWICKPARLKHTHTHTHKYQWSRLDQW